MSIETLVSALTGDRLRTVLESFELDVPSRLPVADLRQLFIDADMPVQGVLGMLDGTALRELCEKWELPTSGTNDARRERIAEHLGESDEVDGGDEGGDPTDEGGQAGPLDLEFDAVAAEKPPREYQQRAIDALGRVEAGQPALLHVATGGGKTRIANDHVVKALTRERGWVLWITKGWGLLGQAASDLARRHQGWDRRLRRLGGAGALLQPLSEEIDTGCVVYTTLQTLSRRTEILDPRCRLPNLVVWDECHWGADTTVARRLVSLCRKGRIRLIGLTATPRATTQEGFETVFSKSFVELVKEGFLATPMVHEPVQTHVSIDARRSTPRGDIAAETLQELAVNKARNRLIVEHYRKEAHRHGPTVVFACNRAHADVLARMFNSTGGVPARPVHSGLSRDENETSVSKFRLGEVRVLVSVEMLTTGFDAPETRTVFLARPTFSEILFSQMVGRAARIHPGTDKRQFHIVEFGDNLTRYGDQLVQAKTVFAGAGGAGTSRTTTPSVRVSPPRTRHTFDPHGTPEWIAATAETPAALHGLWVRNGQTFGIEFELTHADFTSRTAARRWREFAEPLRAALAKALPGRVASECLSEAKSDDKDHSVWNVEPDASCGWEVTTRVLEGRSGMLEAVEGLAALERAATRLGLHVNHRTGTHVHIGWMGHELEQVRRTVDLVKLFEPAVATLVSPSRIVDFDPVSETYDLDTPNQYCQPISSVLSRRVLSRVRTLKELQTAIGDHDARYVTLNLKPLEGIHTMEVRLHNGTLDAGKILLWLSLWQQILWAAEQKKVVPPQPDTNRIVPDGDVLRLAHEWLPPSPDLFVERVSRRRREVVGLWKNTPALRPWLRFEFGWDPHPALRGMRRG